MKLFYWLILITCSFSNSVYAECSINSNKNIVLLKLDDLVDDFRNETGVSSKWQKVTAYLESNKIKASFGLIGESLAFKNEAYSNWVKQRVAQNYIEIWNHGYFKQFKKNKQLGLLGEFNGNRAENQKQSLQKTQDLAKERLDITLNGFGPHDSAVDINTYNQLDNINDIKYVWFYKPVDNKLHNIFVFERTVNLEYPIFKPNFEMFVKKYQERPLSLSYIALQGHPNMWTDAGFNEFVKIIQFLKNENSQFCRPKDILKSIDTERNQ